MMAKLVLNDDHWAGRQIIGDRTSQQDAFKGGVLPTAGKGDAVVLILSDGMGGHQGGALAADAAVAQAFATLSATPIRLDNIDAQLSRALDEANLAVRKARPEDDDTYIGMGCTLVIALISQKGLHWASVGDSPLWLCRKGQLVRLNKDHSMGPVLEYMVANDDMTEEEAARDPRRNQLRSALTGETIALTDVQKVPMPLKGGDLVLLASDGLIDLPENEIVDTLHAKAGLDAICDRLLKQVRAAVPEALDNSTALVFRAETRGWF